MQRSLFALRHHALPRCSIRSSSTLDAAFGKKHIAKGIGRFTDYVLKEGKGSYLYTTDGKKLLDWTSGIAVTNLGHCHPAVTKAAQDQVATLVHGQVNLAFHEPYLQLIQSLLPVMPHKSLDTFFFWNSGSEAVEAAVKLARMATKKQNIIVMQGSYHGRTMGTMAMTKSKTVYGENFGPLMPGVVTTPFPYCSQCPVSAKTDNKYNYTNCCKDPHQQLEYVLKQQSAPSDTAAIIIEPVLGEGGYVVPPTSYMKHLRELCNKHNILLIADEVQSGFGRTGKYFAIEHFDGVVPDILIMAKGIANGFPLSGIVSRKELMDLQRPGSMGGTYAGNAVACAAGVACAKVMKEENILANVAARSKELFGCLHDLQKSNKTKHVIRDVRGLGLMIGVEFETKYAGIAAKVQQKCLEKGMMLLTTSIFETLRFMPPLNISQKEMKEGCDILKAAVEEVAQSL